MEWYWFLLIYVVFLFVFVFVYVMVDIFKGSNTNTFGEVIASIFAAILIAILFVLFLPIAPFCLPILIYQNGGQKHKATSFTLKFTLEGELTPENKTTLEQLGFERTYFNSLANVAKEHYLKRFEKTHIYVYDDGCCSVWGKITEEVKFYIEILKGLPQPDEDEGNILPFD